MNTKMRDEIYRFDNGEIEINGVRYIPESVLMSGGRAVKPGLVNEADCRLIQATGAILAAHIGGSPGKVYSREVGIIIKRSAEFLSKCLEDSSLLH